MLWTKVERIVIETNDSGTRGADVWWILESERGCVCPQGSTGDALDEFQKRFPDFNNEVVIDAMGCTANARFVCWERKSEY